MKIKMLNKHDKKSFNIINTLRLCGISDFTGSLENQRKLWEASCQMLNIQEFGKE